MQSFQLSGRTLIPVDASERHPICTPNLSWVLSLWRTSGYLNEEEDKCLIAQSDVPYFHFTRADMRVPTLIASLSLLLGARAVGIPIIAICEYYYIHFNH
jgi:hypothetical protein